MGKALSEEQQAEARMCVSEEVGGRVCTRQDVRGDQHALMSLAERPGEPLKHGFGLLHLDWPEGLLTYKATEPGLRESRLVTGDKWAMGNCFRQGSNLKADSWELVNAQPSTSPVWREHLFCGPR